MPYISKDKRPKYDEVLDQFELIRCKGDLEYCVARLQKIFMSTRAWKFDTLHDAVYGVQHCADEFRRRYLDKREDEARDINGDVE